MLTDDLELEQTCPACAGLAEVLGRMGKYTVAYRCRNCGMVFLRHEQEEEDDE